MAVILTEGAAQQIQTALARRGSGVGLRVGIKHVGCAGLAYTYDYADTINADDSKFEQYGATLLVDAKSLPFLEGSVLDFKKETFKQGFQFSNPQMTGACGCGESFSVE
ncbi:MAG: iron-sulfur cluster assembly accessory protein [Gammaproteobacteria bacterium]|jgi:iron-sulfur cluster assembly protein|nr:iron-sulfur cluster assembly accessory protein [Gammaproteobacteria bacterium]